MTDNYIELLHTGNYTLIVINGELRTFTRRGVADLYSLLKDTPEFLQGASVADKVVGKAAAALMIIGGVKELHADVISANALRLLDKSDLHVNYAQSVPHIMNRSGNGWCPLEELCNDCRTAEECYQKISSFIDNQNQESCKRIP